MFLLVTFVSSSYATFFIVTHYKPRFCRLEVLHLQSEYMGVLFYDTRILSILKMSQSQSKKL